MVICKCKIGLWQIIWLNAESTKHRRRTVNYRLEKGSTSRVTIEYKTLDRVYGFKLNKRLEHAVELGISPGSRPSWSMAPVRNVSQCLEKNIKGNLPVVLLSVNMYGTQKPKCQPSKEAGLRLRIWLYFSDADGLLQSGKLDHFEDDISWWKFPRKRPSGHQGRKIT